MLPQPVRAELSSIGYLHDTILSVKGVDVPIPVNITPAPARNSTHSVRYLYEQIDTANTMLGNPTSHATGPNAISNIVAISKVDRDVDDLIILPPFCPTGGQYWSGGACAACPTDSFCPSGSDDTILCSSLVGVDPSGGSYSSVSPYSTDTDCRYTAPGKSISGCASVTTNQVGYNGSSWPASTYNVSASGGYIIANNGTASATCSQCGGGTYSTGGASTSCTQCGAGTYSGAGASGCTTCPKDNYCPAGSSAPIACSTVCTDCITNAPGASASGQCYAPTFPVFAIIEANNGVYRMNNPDTDTTWVAEQMPANATSFGTTMVTCATSGNGFAFLCSGTDIFGYNRYKDRWYKVATLSFAPTGLFYGGGIFLARNGMSVATFSPSYDGNQDIAVGNISTGTMPINPYNVSGSGHDATTVNRFWINSLSGATYSSNDGITWTSRGTVASSGGHVSTIRASRDGTYAMSICSAGGSDTQISFWYGTWTNITMSVGASKTSVIHDADNNRWIIGGMGYGATAMYSATHPISASSSWTTLYTGVYPFPNGYVFSAILLRNGRIWMSGIYSQPYVRQDSSGTFQTILAPGSTTTGAALLSIDAGSVARQ